MTNEGTLGATGGGTLRIATLAANRGAIYAGVGGQVRLDDDLPQEATGSVNIKIGGTSAGQFGQVVVGDQAQFAGSLQIEFVDGFVPQAEIVSRSSPTPRSQISSQASRSSDCLLDSSRRQTTVARVL